jgi:RNA-binding protein PNO1
MEDQKVVENADIKEDEFVDLPKQNRKRKQSEAVMDTSETAMKRPNLPPISGEKLKGRRVDIRRIPVPPHRYAPLKEKWMSIYTPIVEQLHLQMRFALKSRNVEIKTCKETTDIGALQRAADFVRAFTLGFEVEDAVALLRLDHLYLESFDITDVKPLKGDHLSRAIGRLAGHHGKTKFTIENVTQTRIVLANSKIHILGSFNNIRVARTALCNLILGSPASKVNGKLRTVAARAAEKL